MKTIKLTTQSPNQTMGLGQALAGLVKPGDIICLFGDLGSGKTTMVKGMAKGLRILDKKVNSPTFVLLNIYRGRLPLYHFDFYRLENTAEILQIGIDEFLYDDGVSVIEWAERLQTLLPEEYLEVRLAHAGEKQRQIQLRAHGQRYSALLEQLR